MHLSYEKRFKPSLYESNIIESLIQHIVGSQSKEEAIYSTRIIINLSYNSEIKAWNYDKCAIPISSVMFTKGEDVTAQLLQLVKRLTEGERSDPEFDTWLSEPVIAACKHESKPIFDLGF